MDNSTLIRAIADLAELEAAGLLPDVKADVAADRRGWPRSDLDRFPLRAPYVQYITREAAQLFALPLADCEAAAIAALLPDGRTAQVLRAIDRIKARLAVAPDVVECEAPPEIGAVPTDSADDAALARERKRRRA